MAREVTDEETDDVDVDEGAGDDVGAEAEGTGETGATPGKRKRRRRRKRKPAAPGAGESDATGPESVSASTASDASTATQAEDADDANEDDADETSETETENGTAAPGGAGGKKRRRRRRKKKPAQDAASSATTTVPSAPPDRHIIDPAPVFQVVSQEEIILDIDEAELAEVRETFGEVDELDDLTLKARRRGVLDELQEEVVFEDLSVADAAHAKRVAEADAARDDAEGDDEGDDEDEAAPSEDGSAASAGADDGRKKKKRRRRKKKAPYVMPELVAPPHKDFWEVWAAKFTREDFSDERFPLPVDPEPPPAASRTSGRGHDRTSLRDDRSDRGERSDRPIERESVVGGEGPVDDRDYVRVELNVGREHGRKSTDIRGLLADLAGLRGRLVRDLTVADRASYFRMPRDLLDSAGKRLDGARDGETELRLVEAPDAPVVLRVDVPSPEAAALVAASLPAPVGDGTLAADAGGPSGTASEPGVDEIAAVPVAPAIPEEPPPAS